MGSMTRHCDFNTQPSLSYSDLAASKLRFIAIHIYSSVISEIGLFSSFFFLKDRVWDVEEDKVDFSFMILGLGVE